MRWPKENKEAVNANTQEFTMRVLPLPILTSKNYALAGKMYRVLRCQNHFKMAPKDELLDEYLK